MGGDILIVLALGVVTCILLAGLYTMFRGGNVSANWSNRLMRYRVLAQFVAIAASRGIKPMFVLFDSCWDPHPKLGPQHAPVVGVHNSGWVQGPGADRLADPQYVATLRDYVTGVVSQFRSDPRVLAWDIWNEPDNPAKVYRKVERGDKLELVAGLLRKNNYDKTSTVLIGDSKNDWDAASVNGIDFLGYNNTKLMSFGSNYIHSFSYVGKNL